jgi:hypothetical protein
MRMINFTGYESYRLPDGRIVQLPQDLSRGALFVSFTLRGGKVVDATRVPHCPFCGCAPVSQLLPPIVPPPPPPERLDDEQICDAVAAALTADGLPAESVYTGGGIWCIQIAEPTWPNAAWLVGNGCDSWGGCLENADGGIYSGGLYDGPDDEDLQLLCTKVDSESQDVAAIAAGVAAAVRHWRSGGRFCQSCGESCPTGCTLCGDCAAVKDQGGR